MEELVELGYVEKIGRRMTQEDYHRLSSQLLILRQVAKEYSGKTIDNIIQQMEARVKQYRQ